MYIKKKTGKGFLDSLQEKNSVKIIGVIGSCRGDGVTTLGIAMANYLAEIMAMKTAIVECNDTKAFETMSNLLLEAEDLEGNNNYIIGKVTYYYGMSMHDFFATYANRYEYVIIDFGNCFREFASNSGRLKYNLVMGSVMPYKSVYHQKILNRIESETAPGNSLHLLHGDEKNVKDYSMKNKINALPIPAITNPYIIESTLANFFQLLF